jgi:hypothetical protein
MLSNKISRSLIPFIAGFITPAIVACYFKYTHSDGSNPLDQWFVVFVLLILFGGSEYYFGNKSNQATSPHLFFVVAGAISFCFTCVLFKTFLIRLLT